MSTPPWAQRWRRGKDIWLRDHPDLEPINPAHYRVEHISERSARAFVLRHHYSQAWPAAILRIGLVDVRSDELVGVAVFGAPAQEKVLTNVFPDLTPYRQSVECQRFVLLNDVPANAETWFLARAIRLLRAQGVQGIVSFADPLPRMYPDGSLLKPGHVGTIYAGSNMTYLGNATPRTLTMLTRAPNPAIPDDRGSLMVLNERTISKIRNETKGADYGVRLLREYGAAPPRAGQPLREWLPTALMQANASKVRHPGNHRWALPLRRNVTIAMPTLPRPEQIGPEPKTAD